MLSIIKQFVKLIFLLLLLASLYGVYLYVTGQNMPKDSEGLFEQGRHQMEILIKSGGKLLEALQENEDPDE